MIKIFSRYVYGKSPLQENRCNMCLSIHVEKKQITYPHEIRPTAYIKNRTMDFVICKNCGYSFCPENFKDYVARGKSSISSAKNFTRVGDGTRPGREFFMATEAMKILQKTSSYKGNKFRVLIFAPGNSLDHQLLRKLDVVEDCRVVDLVNFQNSEYFLPIETKDEFDVVIACEVVEHFTHPRKDFSNLLRYVSKNGLLVISTDIRQHIDFSHVEYPFLEGHTSYYSGQSLIFLAEMNNLFIDFRTPKGPHFYKNAKKYIYLAKKRETHIAMLTHFSVVDHPPSE